MQIYCMAVQRRYALTTDSTRRFRMKYHIIYKGDVIASFTHESDRDMCLETFTEVHNDCVFTPHNDE